MVDLSCDASLVVIEHEITGRETPQALPKATLLLPNEIPNVRIISLLIQFSWRVHLTLVQIRMEHSCLHKEAASAKGFQWARHPLPLQSFR